MLQLDSLLIPESTNCFMESALCLRHSPLPSLPLHIPSLISAARVTRPHFSFSHSSLSLSNTNRCIYRPLGHVFSPIVCAIKRFPTPSTNDEGESKIWRGTVGASLVLACVIGIISCGCMTSPKAIAAGPKNQQKAVSTTQDKQYGTPPTRFKLFNSKLVSQKDADDLKKKAKQLIKSGKDKEAKMLLEGKYKDCEGDNHSQYFVDMALVEVLIYLGQYEDALKRNCLRGSRILPSDNRVPLYKGIIYTMLDDERSAQKCWKEFADSVDQGIPDDPTRQNSN